MEILFLNYLFCFIFLIGTCYINSLTKYHILGKTLASFGFIFIALFAYPYSPNPIFATLMLLGILFCFFGDIFLAIENTNNNKKFFIGGLVSFLIAHIIFFISFNTKIQFSYIDLIIPIISVITTIFLLKLPKMDAGNLKYYVITYSFFVALLLSKGLSLLLFREPNLNSILLALGSILFFVSDLIILFLYFYKHKFKLTQFFNLATYYGALLLLSLSLLFP